VEWQVDGEAGDVSANQCTPDRVRHVLLARREAVDQQHGRDASIDARQLEKRRDRLRAADIEIDA